MDFIDTILSDTKAIAGAIEIAVEQGVVAELAGTVFPAIIPFLTIVAADAGLAKKALGIAQAFRSLHEAASQFGIHPADGDELAKLSADRERQD